MATFLDKDDKKRAELETKVAKQAAKDRAERERKLKLDNARRRFAVVRLNVERVRDKKSGLESEIQALEQEIRNTEKEERFSKGAGSSSQSGGQYIQTEVKIRNAAIKQEAAKTRANHTARLFAEAVTKMKSAEAELTDAKKELQKLDIETKKLQEESKKRTAEKKKNEEAVNAVKTKRTQLTATLRMRKNTLPAVQREYQNIVGEMEKLQSDIRSLENERRY